PLAPPVVKAPAAQPPPPTPPVPPSPEPAAAEEASLGLPYHVARPAALLRGTVPAGSVVAVVTKGEEAFRDLDGLEVWHFPRTDDGEWAGYHPESTADIVNQLQEISRRGARYLLIPDFASWWLDHYPGLRDYLLAGGRLVAEAAEAGSLFELAEARPKQEPRPSGRRRSRPSVSVIAWNTTHNPLGRAHVLAELLRGKYDVEIVGGRFEQFGTGTWPPLRDMDLPLRTFPGAPFPALVRHMEDFARTITTDAVVVSKPRLPSFLLGIMAKALGERPLILDVDDRELTFVGAREPKTLDDLRARATHELTNAHGRWWTQLCESLVPTADHVTVSNPAVEALFGGTLVPHARDERLFDPARVDRDAARARFGFAPDERVVLFGGTPRRHKGVIELAEALTQIGDRRARLCVIGTAELDDLRADLAAHADRLCVVPPQPFAHLPELLAAADVVAVLQDPASEVSHYQMPAKITDALAMGVPCLVRPVPPLEPLIAGGHLEAVSDESLATALSRLLGDLPGARERAHANRDLFLSTYSFSAVRPRLETVVDSLLERPPASPAEHAQVLDFVKERFGDKPAPAPRRSQATDRFDVVMFWKQHDTGLYGRRHDMLMQHLARSPRVGQVIQFDAPVDVATLSKGATDLPTHTALLRERTLGRVNGMEVAPGLHQYSFVYADDRSTADMFPAREEYLLHVKEGLARHNVGERPVVFWVYPKHFEFPELARTFDPDLVVADVIDDHRTWLRPGADAQPLLRNYEEIVSLSDLVLVNCEPMREFLAGMTAEAHLVPNAAEYSDSDGSRPTDADESPPELRSLRGPIVGYAGNLSSRIDVDLLDRMATERPDWNLVLIGSSHAGRSIAPLTRRSNVRFLGPRPYKETKRLVRAFDVGIIPHVDDAMTRAMNPLKAFVYCALGVPVVSTDVSNLGDLRPLISVATDHDDFIARVDTAIARGRVPIDARADAILRRNSWENRTQVITGLIDACLADR
ncbi:MAG: glycosyltransferase, partial [Actinomycetota bacterium]|nr:glycosyltransferase [Actinomycetota bacterium]